MHSAHHSRGRIVFEVFCALALAGSLAGAWAQTDAWALLSAAAVAALYGVWHLADLRRPKPAVEAAPVVAVAERQDDLLTYAPPSAPPVADTIRVVELPPVANAPEVVETPVEAVVEGGAKRSRKSPKPRKARGKQEAQPTIGEIADKLEREFAKVAAEPELPAPEREPEPEPFVDESPSQASDYVPATPLFEPEPFVRQQRAAFGRKSRR